MRAFIITALLIFGGYQAYVQYCLWTHGTPIPDREMAEACFRQDMGTHACLTKLYGDAKIRKCSWYLQWDNATVTGAGDAFLYCVADVGSLGEVAMRGHKASTYRDQDTTTRLYLDGETP